MSLGCKPRHRNTLQTGTSVASSKGARGNGGSLRRQRPGMNSAEVPG